MKKLIPLFSILFIINALSASTDTTKCNWKSRISRFDVYNNCDSHKNTVNIIGKVGLNQVKNCTKQVRRVWKLSSSNSSTVIGSGENLYYKVTQNGTYTICLSLYDSCNNCDTLICKSVTINCLGCNWKSKIGGFDVWNNCDSNRNTKNIIGKFYLNNNYSCSKKSVRKWTVNNNVAGTGENLYYPVYNNGTYTVCMSVYDSCRKCDTTICKTTTINCFPGCNWKSKIGGFEVWNNCDSNKHTKNIIGKFYLNQNYKCSKKYTRKWTVNNSVTGYGEHLYYPVTKNGTYTVCMTVYDSCNKCDTTICKTTTVNCLPGCNWKSKVNDFYVSTNCDSNRTPVYVNGMFILNKNYTCSKRKVWKWSVNNTFAGSSEKLHYKVTQNGVYKVCLWLYDSCNNCDTSFCKEIKVECLSKCLFPKGWSQSNKCAAYSFDGYKVLGSNNTTYTDPCHKYYWDFGDNTKASGKEVKHEYKKNGTYKVCMKVIDTCKNCDTIICNTITINCISNCNWKSKIGGFDVRNNCDSNKHTKNIIGKFYLNQNYNCSKKSVRTWTVNNTVVAHGEHLYYKVTKNGTYTVCMTVYDSCNSCDTTICKTTTISCFPGCNWKSKVNDFHVSTSCDSNRSPIYVNAMFILNKNYTCAKRKVWKWTVNNSVVGYSEKLHFKVAQNGTYNVCLWLYDSCNNCDTSFCKTVTVNCIKGGCNWKNRIGGFDVRTNCDSNKNTVNILGKFYTNNNYQCNKKLYRKWIVNNSFAGYGENLYYKVPKNGTYKVCLVLYDSCNKCDTSICKTLEINCRKLSLDVVSKSDDIQLYPNPAQNFVNVVFKNNALENVNMSVLDLSGRIVKENHDFTPDNGSFILDIRQLPPGVYLIRVRLDQQLYHLKLLKN